MQERFEARVDLLADLADGVVPLFRERCPECGHEPEVDEALLPKLIASPGDRARAMDLIGKYGGLAEKPEIDAALVEKLGAGVVEHAPDAWTAVREAWIGIIGEHVRGRR